MNFKVGVFADGQMTGVVVNEAKQALQDIALKYKCRFELSKGGDSQKSNLKSESILKSKLKGNAGNANGVFLSFGGELEL